MTIYIPHNWITIVKKQVNLVQRLKKYKKSSFLGLETKVFKIPTDRKFLCYKSNLSYKLQ